MSEWKLYKIRELGQVVGGGTPSTKENSYWNGMIPWLTPKDLTSYSRTTIGAGERSISDLGLKNSSAKLLPKGSVLITSRAPIGYVAVSSNDISTNQGFKSVVPNEKLHNFYLYYWVKNNVDFLNQLGTGTTFAEISGSVLKEIEVLLPPLKEQEAIADVLSSIDDKIDLLNRQNETLEAMAQTLFRQWFIEEADESWEEVELGDLLELIKPGTNYQPKRVEQGIPFLNVRNLDDGFISLDGIKHITAEEYKRVHKSWQPEEGDVVISRIGTLGVVSVIQASDLPIAVHYNMLVLRVKQLSYQLLYFMLKSDHFQRVYKSNARQSVQSYVTVDETSRIKIHFPKPNKSTIAQEQSFVHIYEKIKANKAQIKLLGETRDTLLPKLMSGQVRVKLD